LRASGEPERQDDGAVTAVPRLTVREAPGAISQPNLDALPPVAMARKAEQVGEIKATMPAGKVFALAVLAGAFIALGAIFATTTTSGSGGMPYGVERLLGGLTFSLGLILVVVAGAELFTGNNLIVMAWASRRVTTARFAGNLVLVYLGNLVGALLTAAIMILTDQHTFGGGAIGREVLSIAVAKTDLGFVQALALGAFCNALVCLAIWLTYSARTTADKILAIIPPIAAFVAAGFEHSVANMYFIPIGLLVKADKAWVAGAGDLPDLSGLTWSAFFADNLLPVTLGNLIGGTVMVGALYWFVYLRPDTSRPRS
jgi:formate/nitrite transporter